MYKCEIDIINLCQDFRFKIINFCVDVTSKLRQIISIFISIFIIFRSCKHFSFKYVFVIRLKWLLTNRFKFNDEKTIVQCECDDDDFRFFFNASFFLTSFMTFVKIAFFDIATFNVHTMNTFFLSSRWIFQINEQLDQSRDQLLLKQKTCSIIWSSKEIVFSYSRFLQCQHRQVLFLFRCRRLFQQHRLFSFLRR